MEWQGILPLIQKIKVRTCTTVLAQVCHLNEDSFLHDMWQNGALGDDSDGSCFGEFQIERDLELSQIYEGSVLDDLAVSDEIPDIDCFKEISTECQDERDIDDQSIYLDAPVTVADSSLLLMAFAVRHKLSGIALEDLLELIHFHCPKPNKCITELKEFQLFFQALKHPVVKHFYCPNVVCKVYIGTSQPETGAKCAVCGTIVGSSCYFIEIPILEQLKTILSGIV